MLNGNDLGVIVYNIRQSFSDKKPADLIAAYGSIDNARKQAAIDEYTAVVNYLTANTVVHSVGLNAPGGTGGPVTGQTTIE